MSEKEPIEKGTEGREENEEVLVEEKQVPEAERVPIIEGINGEKVDILYDGGTKLRALPALGTGDAVVASRTTQAWSQLQKQILEHGIRLGPFHDLPLYNTLLQCAAQLSIQVARAIYECHVYFFPRAQAGWIKYAEHEIKAGEHARAHRIYVRSVRQVCSLNLWLSYLHFVQSNLVVLVSLQLIAAPELAAASTAGGAAAIAADPLVQLYVEAVRAVGLDPKASALWCEYLAYLEKRPRSNVYEGSALVTRIRRGYQRALQLPVEHLEELWRRYCIWENSVDELAAKERILPAMASKYSAARTLAYERSARYSPLIRDGMAAPAELIDDEDQPGHWRRLIEWERSNPQQLPPAALTARVHFTLAQARTALYRLPEIWLYSAHFSLGGTGGDKAAPALLMEGMKAVPDSLLLPFTLADMYEASKRIDLAREVYEELMKRNPPPALALIQYLRFARRSLTGRDARLIFVRCRKLTSTPWQVYAFAANVEFMVYKQSGVALKIFERGMSQFGKEPGFIAEYSRFLMAQNQEQNTQLLYERALTQLPAERAHDTWMNFLRFTYDTGDLQAAATLEKRHLEALPDTGGWEVESLVERYRYLDLWPCSAAQLRSLSLARTSEAVRAKELEELDGGRGTSGTTTIFKKKRPSAPGSQNPNSASQMRSQELLGGGGDPQVNARLRKSYARPNFRGVPAYDPAILGGICNPLHALQDCVLVTRVPTESRHTQSMQDGSGVYLPDGSLCSLERVPPSLLELLAELPSVNSMRDRLPPFSVDIFCEMLSKCTLPDQADSMKKNSGYSNPRKRKANSITQSNVGSTMAPTHDVFRERQFARRSKPS